MFTLVAHASDLLFATVAPNMAVTESSFAELARWSYNGLWLGLDLSVRLSRLSRLNRLSRLSFDECARYSGLVFVSRTGHPGRALKGGSKLISEV